MFYNVRYYSGGANKSQIFYGGFVFTLLLRVRAACPRTLIKKGHPRTRACVVGPTLNMYDSGKPVSPHPWLAGRVWTSRKPSSLMLRVSERARRSTSNRNLERDR